MQMFSEQTKGYTSALLSASILATTGICIRYLTEIHGMEPLVLAFWRNIILVATLLFILECAYPVLIEIKRTDLLKLFGNGLILALFNYLWIISVTFNGAAVATFLVYSSAPFTVLLGRIVLKEPLNTGKVTAVLLALSGCLLVSAGAHSESFQYSNYGLLMGLGSGLCFAIYSLSGSSAKSDGLNSWTIMLYSFGFAALFLFMAKLVTAFTVSEISTLLPSYFSLGSSVSGWTIMIILAIGPTLIGFGLYNVSLGYLPSSVVNLIATTEPPLTAILAFLILGERLSQYQIFGSCLIITAVILLKTAPIRKNKLIANQHAGETV